MCYNFFSFREEGIVLLKKILRTPILGMTLLMLIGLIVIFIGYSTHPIFLTYETVEVGLNEKYNPVDNISMVFLGSTDDVTTKEKIDTSKLGEKTFHYVYKNKEYQGKYTVIDKTAPVLTLKTYQTDTNEELSAESFVESCQDDSKVTYSISKTNNKEGESTVEITATDSYGNSTTETTTVVRVADTEAPNVASIAPIINVLKGDSFDYEADLGVTDNMDANPKVECSTKVDFDTPGTYELNYTITDRSGNSTTATQTINVIDGTEETAKVVYLTFDDGPSSDVTPQILDTLKKYHAKATFFVIGTAVSANPEMLQREYDEGHSIGLHSYTHDYAIYTSQDTYFSDLNAIADAVNDVLGYKSNIIRFPGGSSNTISANYSTGIMSALVDAVEEKGYEYYDWDVGSGDASGDGVDTSTIIANATSGTADQMTILFHDTSAKQTSADALATVIEYYESQGYVFLGLTKDVSYASHHGTSN